MKGLEGRACQAVGSSATLVAGSVAASNDLTTSKIRCSHVDSIDHLALLSCDRNGDDRDAILEFSGLS